jgi:hypothetical protein
VCIVISIHHFVEVVWQNPLDTKIHQALELRSISVNLRLYPRLYSGTGALECSHLWI